MAGKNAIGPSCGLPIQHQIVNATLLVLAAAKVCFGSQRNFGTKNLKIVPILYYFFHIFSNVTLDQGWGTCGPRATCGSLKF